jgi:hypothetical protein
MIAHADRTALALIQCILDDPEERTTKASCFRAYKQYESEREQLAKVSKKLAKTKQQRDAMIDPLKRLTAELQKYKQERIALKDKSVDEENDKEALLKSFQSQQALNSLIAEAAMWEEEQRVLHLKVTEMEKDFAAKEEALCQIIAMKGVEVDAKDVRMDQQAFEMEELKQRLNDMETQSVEGLNELSKVRALERLSVTKEEELQQQLRAYEAEMGVRESRYGAFERELEESLAQAHDVVQELELELGTCHGQLQESEVQISLLEQERQERRIEAQPVVVTGEISVGPFGPQQEALGPLLHETEEKLKGSEELAATLRRELDETNSALEEKDQKLKILEKFMLEEAIGGKNGIELAESQMKVRELTKKLREMTEGNQVIEGMSLASTSTPTPTKQEATEVETTVDEENEPGESIQTPQSNRQRASQYFKGLKRDDLTQQLARGFQHVMQTSSSALSGSRHGGSVSGSRHGGSVHGKSSSEVPSVLSLNTRSSDGDSVHSYASSDSKSLHDMTTAKDTKASEESNPAEDYGTIQRLKQKVRSLEEKNKASPDRSPGSSPGRPIELAPSRIDA